ncbi:MAG TPA: HAD-IIA family hydrolase [Solirubrobacteraceae bacterium]|nr:HAD-IIA family hydrolase [Solirubrobacteraceae bacterium]
MTGHSAQFESETPTAPPPFEAYVFDLDGTVYLDERPIDGAPETIQRLRADGARVAFVTNHPLEPNSAYAERLTRIGVPATAADITTSVDALISYLGERHPGRTVLAIAEHEVRRRLEQAGFPITADPRATDVVVVSFDRTFDYAKLHAGYRAVRERGAAIVATNPDPFCPTRDGGLPDCAAMLAALEACTGARAEAIVGKPSPHMITAALDRLGVSAADAAMIGDRILTDVAMGQAVGAAGVLVMSGATSPEELRASTVRPDYVLSSIRDLVAPLDAGG